MGSCGKVEITRYTHIPGKNPLSKEKTEEISIFYPVHVLLWKSQNSPIHSRHGKSPFFPKEEAEIPNLYPIHMLLREPQTPTDFAKLSTVFSEIVDNFLLFPTHLSRNFLWSVRLLFFHTDVENFPGFAVLFPNPDEWERVSFACKKEPRPLL